MVETRYLRNFAIIAHIDHGKSTLADRLIEQTGSLAQRDMKEQVLDSMDIERERGITIKAQTVRLDYEYQGEKYVLNLIDTPGHVDFSYEVSRSLTACEGALLIVDAAQGVEAQTLANVYLAIEAGLEIVPILNKVDLPAAEPDRVRKQIEDVIGLSCEHAVFISAKTGKNIEGVLEAIIMQLPPPPEPKTQQLCALLVDSWYDSYLGVVILVRVFSGTIKKGQKVRMLSNNAVWNVERVGVFNPRAELVADLSVGEVGFLTAGVKAVADTNIGDTITEDRNPIAKPLAGFKPSVPVVFCGLFPVDNGDYKNFRDAIDKLTLNDSSFHFEAESSVALGLGFRCGFLGLLHMEIILERLTREFDLDLISTAPSVVYKIMLNDGREQILQNPVDFPEMARITSISEPWIKARILVPDEYMGSVMTLCTDKRGKQYEMSYIDNRVLLVYELPLNEIVFDFYDRLKSVSRGYASFDYELIDYQSGDLVKVNILINSEPVEALAMIVHRSTAEIRGRDVCARLKDLIPRHMFKIPIQAAIGGKVIARETINAMRKDVTAKCYGGDITRKRKLLEKQKKGKKKMRQFGKVDIPQNAFIEALRMGD